MDFQEFAKELQRLRKEQKISQQELAEDIGISRATLSSFENARCSDIGVKKVMQIADYLGYELSLRVKSPFPTFEELQRAKQS